MYQMNNKISAADEAVIKIKELLFSGELERGQKLPGENALASKIGVGRSSVREALKQLAASGYIELVANRGAFAVVTNKDELPSPRDGAVSWLNVNRDSVDELLMVRGCIEPLAAELCATRADDNTVGRLRDLMDSFESALERGEYDNLPKMDYEFHATILEGAGNRFLVGMYRQLLSLFMQYSSSSFRATDSKRDTLMEHRMILNALSAHSPAEARLAMELHLGIAARRMKEVRN